MRVIPAITGGNASALHFIASGVVAHTSTTVRYANQLGTAVLLIAPVINTTVNKLGRNLRYIHRGRNLGLLTRHKKSRRFITLRLLKI
jgi:hypothetical protein